MDSRHVILDMLKTRYGDRWNIRATPNMWIASARKSETRAAPTVIALSLDELIEELESPPKRVGKGLHPLLERLGWERIGTAWRSPDGGGDLLA